jgi:hypothetical protein
MQQQKHQSYHRRERRLSIADAVSLASFQTRSARGGIAQINCIFPVPVEIWTQRQAGRGDAVDHCPVSQDGEIEGRTVEGDKLRR